MALVWLSVRIRTVAKPAPGVADAIEAPGDCVLVPFSTDVNRISVDVISELVMVSTYSVAATRLNTSEVILPAPTLNVTAPAVAVLDVRFAVLAGMDCTACRSSIF